MTETDTSSERKPEKPIDTPHDDAKISSRTPKRTLLCASERSLEKPYKEAKKHQNLQCATKSRSEENPTQNTTKGEIYDKHGKEHEVIDDRSMTKIWTSRHTTTHVKLRGAWNGDRYCLPGVGDASNDFAIPTKAFAIESIVGRYLVALEPTTGGSLAVKREKSIEGNTNTKNISVVLSPAPVCCLLDTLGTIRTHGVLNTLADEENCVLVCFDHTPSVEECFDIPCADVEDISTPGTPSPPPPSP